MTTLEKEMVTVTSMDAINHPTIKAIVSIRKLRIIARADGALWVALPKTEKAQNYAPIVEVHSSKLKQVIEDAVLSYWLRSNNNVDTVADLHSFAQSPQRNDVRRALPRQIGATAVFSDWQMPNDDISDVGR